SLLSRKMTDMVKSYGRRTRSIAVIVACGFGLFACSIATLAAGFSITSVQITNGDVRIAWDAPGGSNYVVQSATGLTGVGAFVDVSPLIFVAGSAVQPTNYTHVGGMLNSTSRFYRV